ncbi:hypothetical protein ASG87_05390 [Frateuria sp. Soil773]|uniref:hypothetical protein n=1 Tax=Frateuria sp. Soil773 TaxID=1736407 RepID=UPI000700A873|nr:hypothetical protein [Frateuria sp. Soil773]KRE88989.1 hypothetical protein ASG87_05390 [Frateuria sp. Soil773]
MGKRPPHAGVSRLEQRRFLEAYGKAVAALPSAAPNRQPTHPPRRRPAPRSNAALRDALPHARWLAYILLLVALVTIIATGFYLGAVHQEPRPQGGDRSSMA